MQHIFAKETVHVNTNDSFFLAIASTNDRIGVHSFKLLRNPIDN